MSKQKQGFLVIIASFIVFMLISTWTKYIRYNDGENLNNNLGYAIGSYGGRTPAGGNIKGTTTGNNIFFSYVVDDKLIMDVKTLAVESQNEGGIIADKYLVIYDRTNLEHAAIYLIIQSKIVYLI